MKIQAITRDIQTENAMRKAYGICIKNESGQSKICYFDSSSLQGQDDKKKLLTWRNQHWINFICQIINNKVVDKITEIKDAKTFHLIV